MSLCSVAALKSLPVLRYSIAIFTFSLVLWDLFESRVVLNPGLGDMRDVASASLMKRLNKTESAVFKLLDAIFPKDLLFDYFDDFAVKMTRL